MRTTFSVSRIAAMLTFLTSIAACSADFTSLIPSASSGSAAALDQTRTADVAPRWNVLARSLIVSAKPNQQEALRALAYLSLAQHEALLDAKPGNSELAVAASPAATTQLISSTGTVDLDNRVDPEALQRGAVAGASVEVLTEIFKSNSAAITAALETEAALSTAAGEASGQFALGLAAGKKIGARIVASARADNFDAPWQGTIPSGPGLWFSSVGKPPVLPMLGAMRPFFMTSGSDFRPAPPPAFGSAEYRTALAEIRTFSDTRTASQDSIAKFWAMATGTLAAGYWNEVATALIEKYHADEARATHVLALMNTAAMDANIACHDAKYTYWMIRPSQADANIATAIGLPNHPSYPSNHGCLSGTAALILANEFPAERDEMARQAGEATVSRYYAGLHYRFDGDAGLEIARRVSELAIRVDKSMGGKLVLR